MKKHLGIIMPEAIGDSVMVFPLINELKHRYKLTVFCNNYVKKVVTYTHSEYNIRGLTEIVQFRLDVLIDFLSNIQTRQFVGKCKSDLKIGFPDGFMQYDLYLEMPGKYSDKFASDIFLSALKLLELPLPSTLDFSFGQKWVSKNQERILLCPGAGNINRCYEIDNFNKLASVISNKYGNITFLLGPSDKYLTTKISSDFDIFYSADITSIIFQLSSSKLAIISEGGLMHLSAAFGIPLVGLFRVALPQNWFPYTMPYQFAVGTGTNNYQNLKLNHCFPLNEILTTIELIYESTRS
jgi:ADP-heptose:LPS heptosyltransferase